MELFKKLLDYDEYLKENPFHQNLEINLKDYGQLDKKIVRETYYSVDSAIDTPYSAELDDLIRLHYLVTSRKVTTILEIGVGKSTLVFDHALEQNKLKYGDFVNKNLRRTNPFQCFSVDFIHFPKNTIIQAIQTHRDPLKPCISKRLRILGQKVSVSSERQVVNSFDITQLRYKIFQTAPDQWFSSGYSYLIGTKLREYPNKSFYFLKA